MRLVNMRYSKRGSRLPVDYALTNLLLGRRMGTVGDMLTSLFKHLDADFGCKEEQAIRGLTANGDMRQQTSHVLCAPRARKR